MLAAIQGETHPSALGPLSQGLAALPVELTPDQAGQALDAILAEMERTWDSDAPRAFGEGLAALAADLNPYQAGQALEAVLAKMEGGLVEGAAALAAVLEPEQAGWAIEAVLGRMRWTTQPDAMRALGKVLAALPLELTPEQADELFNAVLTAMYSTAEAETVRDLSPVFAEFLAELGPKQARRMTSPLLAAFQDLAHTLYVEDTDIFRSIRQELAARPFELTNEQAREAIATILDGINDALVGQDVLQALDAVIGPGRRRSLP
jgi:hypothetical protein